MRLLTVNSMQLSVLFALAFLGCYTSAQLIRNDKMKLGDYNPETKHYEKALIGGDDHDFKEHKKQLWFGGDNHDKKFYKKKHEKNKKNKILKKTFGGDDHDMKPHSKKTFGGDDHDMKLHSKKTFGGDDHDMKPHPKNIFGGDDHDLKPHTKKQLGRDDHDKKEHKKKKFRGDEHEKKVQKKRVFVGDTLDVAHIGAFKVFTKQFNKSYENQTQFKRRFKIFRQNMEKVHIFQLNEQGTAKYGPTKFADLTEEEFHKMLGFRPDMKPALSSMNKAELTSVEIPDEFDWRDKGIVTPVKNQGACGSCWAFSVTGNVEGQWALINGELLALSEQELVDCDKLDSGCNGGLPENAYQAIEEMGGLETETAYPYDAADETCHLDKSLIKVTINGSLELPKDEVELASWLYQNGPISIGINANALQFYMGGVSHPMKFLCNPESLDHGMLIVGYGVHTTKYLHKTQPYWLVKNSWGEDWGEKGYYRVYRGDETCGLNRMATSSIVS